MSQTISTPFETPPAEGDAIEVAPGVLWVRLPLPMKLDHVNIYALDDGDSWTVIDTGLHTKRTVAIWEKLLAGPLAGKTVGRVVLTHHHPDHIGMAGWFQARGAEIIATRTAWLLGRMLTLDVQDVWPEEALQFYRRAGMDKAIFEARSKDRPFNFSDTVHSIALGFTRIQEGSAITMAGRVWDVRIGNGHAPEHATFWSRDDNLVLGGDQLLASISPNLGVYPTEPDADPVAEWLVACEYLAQFATADQLVLPGHKLPFTGLPLRLNQLIENHHGALARLLDHLSQPRTAHDCFMPLFKREIGEAEYGLALVESIAHLNHLHLSGQACRNLREDGVYTFERKAAT